MKYFLHLIFVFVIGAVMVGDLSAKEISPSEEGQFPPFMTDSLFQTVSRETKKIFVKQYSDEEYSIIEFSDDERKMLIERELVVSVLEACAFSSGERLSERALQQASSAGWSQRQLNYLQSVQAVFGKIAWSLRVLVPCKEKMRAPFKNRYEHLDDFIIKISKGQPQ
jgi:hypothetical protein